MKKLKRVLAVLLTAIMTLAMATTAFAAAPKGSLTVKVNAKNTLEGQTIKVYKLFDLSVSKATSYNYVVNEDYKTMIATALGESDSSSEALYNKLTSYKDNPTAIQKFADDFTAAALTAQPPVKETQSSGKIDTALQSYMFNNLDYGYYLVYQTGTKELQSSLVTVEGDTTITLKGEAPSIEKTADKETVEIGQVVTYTITGTIPDTTGYNSYVYKIKDTLTNGLDFVKDADGTKVDDINNYLVSVKIGEGQATTQKATLGGDNNRTMTLNLSDWIKANQASKGQEFTVTYYAKVNANAVVTEKNSASLEYGNDQDNTTTTKPSEAKTPTYPLQIHKLIKGQNSSYLADATFRLYKTEKDAKANTNAIAVTGSNGSYTVDPTSQTFDMVSIGNGTTVGTNMNLKLNGLAAGDYWLVETAAPDGYNYVATPFKITITKSEDANVNNWKISKNDVVDDDEIIDIENSAGTILPGTGGMGTILFTVVGVALILVVAASFVISRRKRA